MTASSYCSDKTHAERLARYDGAASSLLEWLAGIRRLQAYCRRYGATPQLDALVAEGLQILRDLRATFGVTTH